jgi:xylulokinase
VTEGSSTDAHILAFDLGTTALKVGLVRMDGRIVDRDTEPQHVSLLPGGGAEQDPEAWWGAIVRATRRMLARADGAAARIVAVNASVQWSGTVPIDADGRPLANAMIWMDSRGAPQAKRATDGLIKVEGYGLRRLLTWIRLTGGAPTHSGKDSIAHILWIRATQPDLYRRTALFLEPKDWLNLRLTGRAVSSFDAMTLHWVTDTRKVDDVRYSDRLLSMAGLDRSKLPDMVPTASVIGTVTPEAAAELGIFPEAKVVSGAADLLAAAVGSGAVLDFQPHLYVGTSSWLTCHVPYKKTDLLHNMASLPSALPGTYLLANEQESAGVCLARLKDQVLFPDDGLGAQPPPNPYPALDGLAETAPPGSNGLIFTPWLNGERTPVDDRFVRGGFFNQTLQTTRADMVRAVLEGVAFNSRWLLTYVEKFIGRRLDRIRMIGGGASSDLWCRIHADVLGRTILRVEDPVYCGIRGAALQAAVGLGTMRIADIPDAVPVSASFEPDPATKARYDELFACFVDLYKRTKPVYARLNRGRGEA